MPLTIIIPSESLSAPVILGTSVPLWTIFTGELHYQFGVEIGTFLRLQGHIVNLSLCTLHGVGIHAKHPAIKIHKYQPWPDAQLVLQPPGAKP